MASAIVSWRERLRRWNFSIAAVLFPLQIIHLLWLTVDVVLPRLFGIPAVFDHIPLARILLILVDYTEIPALVSTSLVYVDSFRQTRRGRDLLYVGFLNIQWLHLFWITDAFVLTVFAGPSPSALHPVVAWVAILIDYLEVPVMMELLRRAARRTTTTRTA
ncbi:MAG: hypothetical protein Q8R32_00475 [bacterium]|nr:hypothetical protein [bacterium]